MRVCPNCGGAQRRQLAPAFYECETPGRSAPAAPHGEATPTACGERYMDSDARPRLRWMSSMFGAWL